MSSAKRYLFTGSKADDSAVHKAISKGITGKCCCDTPNVNNMTEHGRYNAYGMTRLPKSEPELAPPSPPSNNDSSSDMANIPTETFVEWIANVPYYVSVPLAAIGTGIYFRSAPTDARGLVLTGVGAGLIMARMISHTQPK